MGGFSQLNCLKFDRIIQLTWETFEAIYEVNRFKNSKTAENAYNPYSIEHANSVKVYLSKEMRTNRGIQKICLPCQFVFPIILVFVELSIKIAHYVNYTQVSSNYPFMVESHSDCAIKDNPGR